MTSEQPLPRFAARQAETCIRLLNTVANGVDQGKPADRTLHDILRNHREFGSRDRRLFGDSIFTWLRWYGWVRDLPVEMGLLVAWQLDAQQEWPPALQSLLADLQKERPSPLAVDTPLQERYEQTAAAFDVELAPFDELLPTWLKKECSDLLTWEALFESHIHRPATWLRVDRTATDEVHAALVAEGGVPHPTDAPQAYSFQSAGAVSRSMQAHADVLEIQDLASQQVVNLCAPSAGEYWWDACCGTGGKSLHLLDAADRKLDLTATDRRDTVFPEFKKRTRRHGLGKTRNYALDLSKEDSLLPNIEFDGILVDAPCTGSGTWARNPDGPLRTSQKDLRQLPHRQLRILNKVAPTLKVGGKLVYAVCSWTQSETNAVVSTFLDAHPEFELTPTPHPLTGVETDGRVLITPEESQGDAMFVAIFKKTS